MIISSVMASVGAGMVSTFEPGTSTPEWIGYQIIYGFGMGSGMQQGLMAAQTVLPLEDVPSGTSIIAFMQTISGAIFISIAQNVFSNKLASGIAEHVPGLNPEVILGAGATSLKYVVPERLMESVIHVYNDALVSTYYVSIAMSCLSLVGALSVEWKNMKKSGNGPATMHAA
ncbi:hypothetical protein MPER_06491 [Moniliophthora perniciosa FA553]|nr:hypothetical protein MPER_06491 [Moniliophthora perniciosa FA553]